MPFCTFFLLNFFATLSHTFEEAAAVDGCTPIKTFFRIMLPLAQPGIITVGIFLFVNIWNEFFVAMIFATSSEVRPLAYGLYSLIQAMSTNGKWAELFASVMIVVVPTFILYLVPVGKDHCRRHRRWHQGMSKKQFVLIMTDTQRLDMVSCYQDVGIKTPNIDALGRRGRQVQQGLHGAAGLRAGPLRPSSPASTPASTAPTPTAWPRG